MAGAVEIDESGFPLVFSTFRGHVTSEMITAYYARIDAWCREPRRYASIINIARIDTPSAAERKQIAQGVADRHATLGQSCAGLAIIATNPLLRGAVTAVLWLQQLPHPLELVVNEAAARAICATWLATPPVSRC